ncbi:MAG: hybrid sensor histidine kinase/response regulator [Bdellovibrionota bacterium]|nr:MAG: hybrid sensor histidine kinase/response regulator [Bdellovibrionota bacterium]
MKAGAPILLVDANPLAAKNTIDELSRHFPETMLHVAHGEAEGLQVASQQPVELVILDGDIPDNNAFEFIRQLKNLDDDPVVLMLSSVGDPTLIHAAYEAGCTRHILKAGEWRSDLGMVVRQLLRMRRLEQENLKLLSRVLEANVMLEERNRRLDEFCASLAHDIRGPLAGVSMRLEYLMDGCRELLDERHLRTLRNANDSLERLIGMVQAMYEYARLGEKATRMQAVSLQQLMSEVINDLHFDDRLDIQVRIGELPKVWGNPDLLRRVFSNLISNSVKYSDKARIEISVEALRKTESSLGAFHELAVTDNGPGIKSEDHAHVFQMFSRGENKSSKEGSGIGLAVVQRIVELHYGRVWVDPQYQGGARFILSLPAEPIRFA